MEIEEAGKSREEEMEELRRAMKRSNILLTEKVVETPKTQEELDLLNPGAFSYEWLTDPAVPPFSPGQTPGLPHLTPADLRQLDLNAETDKLFLVKWKDLSYS